MLVLVLEGESYIQFVVDVLNSKWGIARRQVGVGETLHPREIRVVHFHRATVEIVGINESTVPGCADRQAFINRPCPSVRVINCDDSIEQVYARAPSTDGSILSGENEQ